MTDHADNTPDQQGNEAAATATESRAPETGKETPAANVNLTALVTEVVKYLVDAPEEVRVEEFKEGRNNIVLELEVAQKDIGKVIGKQGRTIRSLRNLVDAAASKLNVRAQLELIEDDDDYEDDDQGGNGGNSEAAGREFRQSLGLWGSSKRSGGRIHHRRPSGENTGTPRRSSSRPVHGLPGKVRRTHSLKRLWRKTEAARVWK